MAQTRSSLQGKMIAFLVANEGVEQIELTEPWRAVEEAGGRPQLIAPDAGRKVQAFNHLDKADTFAVDTAVAFAITPETPDRPTEFKSKDEVKVFTFKRVKK